MRKRIAHVGFIDEVSIPKGAIMRNIFITKKRFDFIVSIPKGAIMSSGARILRFLLRVSIPKGAIMRMKKQNFTLPEWAVSIPKGAIMSGYRFANLYYEIKFQFQKVRL